MEETKTELQLIKLSEIQSQEVSWLWFPFIPYGNIALSRQRKRGGSVKIYWLIA